MFYPIKPPKSVTMDSGLCFFLDCGINSCVAMFFVFVLFGDFGEWSGEGYLKFSFSRLDNEAAY